MQYFIDFTNLLSEQDVYKKLGEELNFPEYFGNNLDALWDVITGDLELPATVHFIDITEEKAEQFADIISVFSDATAELNDDFNFQLHLIKTKEDEDAVG